MNNDLDVLQPASLVQAAEPGLVVNPREADLLQFAQTENRNK